MKRIIGVSISCILIDQIIKILITKYFEFAKSVNIINNFFRITYLKNTGAAFSVFSGNQIFLILVTVLFLMLVYLLFIKNKKVSNIDYVLYGLLFGGAISNLIDRVRLDYVIDYLDFNIGSYNYPVFNLADMLIVISVIILLIKNMKEDKDGNKSR